MSSTDKISNWFREYEVSRSAIAERLGINNRAPTWVMENAVELATHGLDPIREHFGIPVSPQSWFRCEELEKVLTWEKGFRFWCAQRTLPWITRQHLYKNMGAQTSWDRYFERKSHPKGMAVDIEIAGISNDVLFDWIKEHLEFDQLIREFPQPSDPTSGWVHMSWAGVQCNRNVYFSIPYYDKYA